MPITNAQNFLLGGDSADLVTGHGGTRLYTVETAAAPAAPNVGQLTETDHGTGGAVARTVRPQVTSTAATDPGVGWVIPRSMLPSTADGKAFVPAGQWNFRLVAKGSVAQTGAGGDATTFSAKVFRGSPTNTFTNLFTIARAPVTLTTLTNQEITWATVVDRPQFTLEPDEFLHVLFYATAPGKVGTGFKVLIALQALAPLGTLYSSVLVPPPGVRTLFLRSPGDSAPADDATTRTVLHPRGAGDTAGAEDAAARVFAGVRSVADNAPATDAASRIVTYVRAALDNIGPSGGGGTGPVTQEEIDAIAAAVVASLSPTLDVPISSRASDADLDTLAAAVANVDADLGAALSTLADAIGTPAQAAALANLAALVGVNLDVPVSTRATPADVTVTVPPTGSVF